MTTYTIADVHSKKATSKGLVDLTNEEKQKLIDEWNEYESQSSTRKLLQIRKIRKEKLMETDYLGISDNTMSSDWIAKRKSWRDIPQNFTTESQYDLLLARDSNGNLTHSIWSKP